MEAQDNRNWFIIYTIPNLERKIFSELERQKIKAYLPMQRVFRQWSDRKKEVKVPMFPSYIFINTTEKVRFELYNIHGVLKFLTYNGKPAILTDEEILQIMQFENTAFSVEQHLIQGDDVIITQGPFTGLKGKLFCRRGKQRFGIMLKSLNQTISCEVELDCLRKIE